MKVGSLSFSHMRFNMSEEKIIPTETYAWYACSSADTLRYGDNRKVAVGETHTIEASPEMCKVGLHGCSRVLGAIGFYSSNNIYRVKLEGITETSHSKLVAKKRTYVQKMNGKHLLRKVFVKLLREKGFYEDFERQSIEVLPSSFLDYLDAPELVHEVIPSLPKYAFCRMLTDFDLTDNSYANSVLFIYLTGYLNTWNWVISYEVEKLFQEALTNEEWKSPALLSDLKKECEDYCKEYDTR